MMSFVILTTIIIHALGIRFEFPGNLPHLEAELEDVAKSVKVPRAWSKKILSKLTRNPAKQIKTFAAPNFFMDKYEIQISDKFAKQHVLGTPSETYMKDHIFTNFDKVEFQVPKDLNSWKYGTSRTIKTKNYVYMKESIRNSRKDQFEGGKNLIFTKIGFDIQRQLYAKATRYKGKSLGKGNREPDIFVIEEIEEFVKPPVNPNFEKGAISGLVINDLPVEYGGMNTWKAPTVFVRGLDVEIRGTERFINNHVLGNPGKDFSRPLLFVFPTDRMVELSSPDINDLELGVIGIVQTFNPIKSYNYKPDLKTGKLKPAKSLPFHQAFDAIKYENEETGGLVLVLVGWHGYEQPSRAWFVGPKVI
jgi:hypothetical protein